jgi:ComF family protein
VWLEPGARRAVHSLKYDGLPRVAADIAEAMVRVLEMPSAAAVLVPVPLGAKRLRARGYNQSLWLAEALGGKWRRPVRPELLARVRDTETQTALTPGERLANVAGAFTARMVVPSPIILVDDVFTTGATLAAAAVALAAAGVTQVSAVTFGRATIPDFT